MREKICFGHLNGREISSGELRYSGLCDTTGVDIFATRDERYGTGVRGIGKSSAGDLFASSFHATMR